MNNIPLNGWPQIKDLPELQHRVERIAKIEAWKADTSYIEETGAEIEIDNCLGVPANKLSLTFAAQQDLHGYSKPWAGGAGKNKLPLTLSLLQSLNTSGTWSDNEYTFRGVTYTCETANDNIIGITVDGTAEEFSVLVLARTSYNAGYTLNGGVASGSSAVFSAVFYTDGVYAAEQNIYNEDAVIRQSETYTDITYRITVAQGSTASDLSFYPMVRLSSVTDTTFEPYTNICPITGLTEATVQTTDGTDTNNASIQLGQTVYGGTINFNTGVLTIDKGYAELVGADSEGWNWSNSDATAWFYANLSGCIVATNKCITDKFDSIIPNPWNNDSNAWTRYEQIHVRPSAAIVPSGQTAEGLAEFKTWLAANHLQAVYTLATPVTIQLTPDTLTMLRGSNTVTTNCETITVKALTGRAF